MSTMPLSGVPSIEVVSVSAPVAAAVSLPLSSTGLLVLFGSFWVR
jgi:hypothetical protein